MPDETNTPTENVDVRGLPTWAADAIRARASKTGVSYSAMVRIILTDAARRYEAATPAVTVAAPAAQTTEG